jgi:hypothetical protein
VIPPITEAMMIRCQLHAILEKHGIVDERKRAVCGLEILIWIKESLLSGKEFDAP